MAYVVEWFCPIFVAITCPIYIFFILILIMSHKNEALNGPFFKLCISVGICDILSMFNNYLGVRFPYYGWGDNFYLNGGPLLAKTIFSITWGLRTVQGVGTALMAINRATAIIWLINYKNLWSNRVLKAAIGFQVLMFVPPVLLLAFADYHWETGSGGNGSLITAFDSLSFKDIVVRIVFLEQLAVTLLITVAYVSLFASFRRKNNRVVSLLDTAASYDRSQEMKLAAMGAIVCLFEILWTLLGLWTLFFYMPPNTWYLIYDSLTDIYSGINPYLLLIFSSAVRDRIKRIFRPLHLQSSPDTN